MGGIGGGGPSTQLGLVYAGDHWYLLALRDGTERTYRVSRIEGLTVLAEAATRPADVDLEASFLAHWASFRNSLPKVTVTCPVHDDAWESLSRTALRTLSREVGDGGWSRTELEFAEDAHAVRALGRGTDSRRLRATADQGRARGAGDGDRRQLHRAAVVLR